MENKKEHKKVSKLTIAQALLSVVVLATGGLIVSEVVDGKQTTEEMSNMAMASENELNLYQEEINKMQETGVAVSDPFDTDRMNVNGIQYIGRINIPKIKVNEPVVWGTTEDDMKHGVGIMEGSDIPMGKKGESSIIAGHRGYLWRGDFFKDLDKLELDDTVEVHVNGEKLTYKIIKISTVKNDEVEKVLYDEERTLLALVTSNPYWVTEDRLLVEAELDNG